MVERDGIGPVALAGAQVAQEAGGVADVAECVEAAVQVAERVRMVFQVDLHAADVDRGNAVTAQARDLRHRIFLGGGEVALAFHIV